MSSDEENKIDKIYDLVFDLHGKFCTLSQWAQSHDIQHARESSWRRFITPFIASTVISLASLVIVLYKNH
jgi:hypothetical protein